MFTGIVQEVGKVVSLSKTTSGMSLEINSEKLIKDLNIDDSVSVNGCCQTVVDLNETSFVVNVVESTIKKTILGIFKIGDCINLELALRPVDRIGGHLVQGHVNTICTVKEIYQIDNFFKLKLNYENPIYNSLVINEGSICVNGVSLTVNNVFDNQQCFDLYVIPHTWNNTNLKYLRIGQMVNLEFDVIAQYLNKIMSNNNISTKTNNALVDFLGR